MKTAKESLDNCPMKTANETTAKETTAKEITSDESSFTSFNSFSVDDLLIENDSLMNMISIHEKNIDLLTNTNNILRKKLKGFEEKFSILKVRHIYLGNESDFSEEDLDSSRLTIYYDKDGYIKEEKYG